MKTQFNSRIFKLQRLLVIPMLVLPLVGMSQTTTLEGKENQPTETTKTLEASGHVIIKGETHYYATAEGKTKYYNRFGEEVNTEGDKVKTVLNDAELAEENAKTDSGKVGHVKINGELYFYATTNGVKKYYDRKGNEVDKEGKLITPKKQ